MQINLTPKGVIKGIFITIGVFAVIRFLYYVVVGILIAHACVIGGC